MSLNSGLPSTLGKFSGSRLEIVRPTNTSTIPEGTEVDNKFHMDNNDNRLFIVIVTLVKWWKVDDIRLCNGDYDNNDENYDEGGNNSMTMMTVMMMMMMMMMTSTEMKMMMIKLPMTMTSVTTKWNLPLSIIGYKTLITIKG